MKWLGPGMLSEHEDNPCYRVAHNWTFLEKQVWVWILRDIKEDLLISTGTQETVLSATEVSQYLEGPLKNPRPYFDFATCTVPFLMILFRICVSGAGHDPQHNSSGLQNEKRKKKSQVIDVCVCYKWSDFIRYGRFYIQHSAGWSQHRLENLLWFLTLPFSFFIFWHSSFSGSQQLCHFCVPRQ